MASSAHIGGVSTGSFLHNDRTQTTTYLIDTQINNEYTVDSNTAYKHFQDLKQTAIKSYIETVGQNPQKNTKYLKEVIINLEQHHTMKDVDKVSKLFSDKGYTILQQSVHKDEGHIETPEKVYIMGRTNYTAETPNVAELHDGKFFEMHKEGKEWLKGKEITEYEKHYNYHAHVTYFNNDLKTGKSIKAFAQGWEKSALQTDVAKILNMERGKVSSTAEAKKLGVEVEPKSKRESTKERRYNSTVQKIGKIALVKDVKFQYKEERQKIIASHDGTKKIYSELKTKYDVLEDRARNKDLTIEELKSNLSDVQKTEKFKDELLHELSSTLGAEPNVTSLRNTSKEIKELSNKTNIIKFENQELKKENQILAAQTNVAHEELKLVKIKVEHLEQEQPKLSPIEKVNKQIFLKMLKVEEPSKNLFWVTLMQKLENFIKDRILGLEKQNEQLIEKLRSANIKNNALEAQISDLRAKDVSEVKKELKTSSRANSEPLNSKKEKSPSEILLEFTNQHDKMLSKEDIAKALKSDTKDNDYQR